MRSVGRSVKCGINYNNCEAIKKNTLERKNKKEARSVAECVLFFCGY